MEYPRSSSNYIMLISVYIQDNHNICLAIIIILNFLGYKLIYTKLSYIYIYITNKLRQETGISPVVKGGGIYINPSPSLSNIVR